MELAETAGTYEHANRVIDLALVSWLLQDFSMFYHVLPCFAWCGKFQVCWIFVIGTLVIPDS